MDTKVAKTVIR